MSFAEWAALPLDDGTHILTELPLSPIHPLRHGHLGLTITVADGHVQACAFDAHAGHRGDERLLEVRDVRQGLALLDRHGWLTAAYAEALFARIVESMLGITVSDRVRALRELAMALNRKAAEAYWEAVEASLTGVPSDALARREGWLTHVEQLTGARMHTTYVRIGGVAHDIDPEQERALAAAPDADVAAAARALARASGPVQVALPKSVRLPQGEAYDEIDTPHGRLGMWVFGRGDKLPHRVHLRTPGFAALAQLEREAIGLPVAEFLMRLARTRLVLGEVSR